VALCPVSCKVVTNIWPLLGCRLKGRNLITVSITNSFSFSVGVFLKLKVPQLLMKLFTFYATLNFITTFVTARHWSLSWASWIQPTLIPYLSEIYFNIVFLSTPGSPKWSLTFIVTDHNLDKFYHLHESHMPRSSHPHRYDHPNYIGWRSHILKYAIIQFSSILQLPASLISSPQHPVLRTSLMYLV
jgi:hypothetical protein